MAHTTINASETDADSPLNQTLMDKIRTNDADHETRILGLEGVGNASININGSGSAGAVGTAKNYIVNTTINWLDRHVSIRGVAVEVIATGVDPGTLADAQRILPGGTEDDESFWTNGNAGAAGGAPDPQCSTYGYDYIDGWFYTSDGGSAYNTKPYLPFTSPVGGAHNSFYFWVDDGGGPGSAGNLILTCIRTAATEAGYAAWNLQILYSADLGGH